MPGVPGFQAPAGTFDVLPPESSRYEALVARFADHVARAGYRSAATALRPEGTASVARAYVQRRPTLPFKAWYVAPLAVVLEDGEVSIRTLRKKLGELH